MLVVYEALSRKDAIPHPTRPGYFTSPHPDNDGTVLAIEPGKVIAKRPKGSNGAYEAWRDDGTKAVWQYVHDGRTLTFAILLVD